MYKIPCFIYKINILPIHFENVENFISEYLKYNEIYQKYYIIVKIKKFIIEKIQCIYDQNIAHVKIYSIGYVIKKNYIIEGGVRKIQNQFFMITHKQKIGKLINVKENLALAELKNYDIIKGKITNVYNENLFDFQMIE